MYTYIHPIDIIIVVVITHRFHIRARSFVLAIRSHLITNLPSFICTSKIHWRETQPVKQFLCLKVFRKKVPR